MSGDMLSKSRKENLKIKFQISSKTSRGKKRIAHKKTPSKTSQATAR